jgi:hypothetical protein
MAIERSRAKEMNYEDPINNDMNTTHENYNNAVKNIITQMAAGERLEVHIHTYTLIHIHTFLHIHPHIRMHIFVYITLIHIYICKYITLHHHFFLI